MSDRIKRFAARMARKRPAGLVVLFFFVCLFTYLVAIGAALPFFNNLSYTRARISPGSEVLLSGSLSQPLSGVAAEPEPRSLESEGSIVVDSDESLGPNPEKTFVVSFFLRFAELPEVGRRQKFIAKYDRAHSPYAGWAIAFRRLRTSQRPEVYWQDLSGKGGWFSFEAWEFKPHTWYSLTMLARPEDYLGLFVQELNISSLGSSIGSATGSSFGPSPSGDGLKKIKFLGGFSLSGLSCPATSGPLEVGVRGPRPGNASSEVAEILVARSNVLPNDREELSSLLSGGSIHLSQVLPVADISLWIDEKGVDKSHFSRKLS